MLLVWDWTSQSTELFSSKPINSLEAEKSRFLILTSARLEDEQVDSKTKAKSQHSTRKIWHISRKPSQGKISLQIWHRKKLLSLWLTCPKISRRRESIQAFSCLSPEDRERSRELVSSPSSSSWKTSLSLSSWETERSILSLRFWDRSNCSPDSDIRSSSERWKSSWRLLITWNR